MWPFAATGAAVSTATCGGGSVGAAVFTAAVCVNATATATSVLLLCGAQAAASVSSVKTSRRWIDLVVVIVSLFLTSDLPIDKRSP
jgi:hypothetical protein